MASAFKVSAAGAGVNQLDRRVAFNRLMCSYSVTPNPPMLKHVP